MFLHNTFAEQSATVRSAAVAGQFYPADPGKLQTLVQEYINQATIPALPAVRAVIAPHAGYAYSGVIAGYSYKALSRLPDRETHPYTIYLLGPAHYLPLYGIGLSSVEAFETPLGSVPVAQDRVRQLLEYGGPFLIADEAHKPEHSLEVQLPFLQSLFGNFRIVPMLVDQYADPQMISAHLAAICKADDASLVVVSSDLSHYHAYADANRIDQATVEAIVAGNTQRASLCEACGLQAILSLMYTAQALKWMTIRLAYCNSGDTGNHKERVVGYSAIAFNESGSFR